MKKFRMHVGYRNQKTAYWNSQAEKNIPAHLNGVFTMDELRSLNNFFKIQHENWEPVVERNYADHYDLFHPYRNLYFMWCSEIIDDEIEVA